MLAIGKISLTELMDGFSLQYKEIIENVENHMQCENLFSDNYIVIRNEDIELYGPGKNKF